MTILYRPVLIESAEQAEALPIGTVAIDKPDTAPPSGACIKGSDGGWYETGGPTPWEGEQMVGDTALVPIEAEEEARVTPEALTTATEQMLARAEEAARVDALPPGRLAIQQQTRLVTPREDA